MYTGPRIVREGLVLHLDAANIKSYVSGSTTWVDISTETNNGTLINGPIFDNSNNGTIITDGVNDYILLGPVPFTGTSTTSVSWGVWVNPLSTAGNIMSMASVNPQGGWNMPPIAATGQKFRGKIWPNSYLLSQNTYTLGSWYYLVLVWKYSPTLAESGQFFYVNGVLQSSQTNITYSSSGVNNYLFLGQTNPGADNTGMFYGKYGMFHVYGNKALTAEEVLQNYEATKSRFGL